MFKRVYEVATGDFRVACGDGMPGWQGNMSYKRLADLLQQTEAGKGETLTHIVIGPQGLELRFKLEVPDAAKPIP
jgi:hypothetical protein